MHKFQFSAFLFCVIVGLLALSSCYTTKKAVYFNDLPDSGAVKKISLAKFKEPLIQSDDILSVAIQTIDPTATSSLNQVPSAVPSSGSATSAISGYLVNKDGEIDLQILGKVKVAGLTTVEASNLVMQKAMSFFKGPTVQVRSANYKINVLGEVGRPGAYVLPNEKISVIDAISLAGDITISGKRENILVVRDKDGVKEYARLNLNSSDIFNSPYYYLRQNDIIYVEPTKAKISNANDGAAVRNIALGVSILTLISLLIVRFK